MRDKLYALTRNVLGDRLRELWNTPKTSEVMSELEMHVRNRYVWTANLLKVPADLEEVSLAREERDPGHAYVLTWKDGHKEVVGPDKGPQVSEPGFLTW